MRCRQRQDGHGDIFHLLYHSSSAWFSLGRIGLKAGAENSTWVPPKDGTISVSCLCGKQRDAGHVIQPVGNLRCRHPNQCLHPNPKCPCPPYLFYGCWSTCLHTEGERIRFPHFESGRFSRSPYLQLSNLFILFEYSPSLLDWITGCVTGMHFLVEKKAMQGGCLWRLFC